MGKRFEPIKSPIHRKLEPKNVKAKGFTCLDFNGNIAILLLMAIQMNQKKLKFVNKNFERAYER